MTRHHTSRLALLASTLLVAGLATGVRANDEALPFSATLDGFASPVFQPDGCTIINDEHGTGQARHLGDITWQSHEIVNVCSNPDSSRSPLPTAISCSASTRRWRTWTSAPLR